MIAYIYACELDNAFTFTDHGYLKISGLYKPTKTPEILKRYKCRCGKKCPIKRIEIKEVKDERDSSKTS